MLLISLRRIHGNVMNKTEKVIKTNVDFVSFLSQVMFDSACRPLYCLFCQQRQQLLRRMQNLINSPLIQIIML